MTNSPQTKRITPAQASCLRMAATVPGGAVTQWRWVTCSALVLAGYGTLASLEDSTVFIINDAGRERIARHDARTRRGRL